MKNTYNKIDELDWLGIGSEIQGKGYALVPGFLSGRECSELIALYDKREGYRKTVVMERYRFGFGEYKYFDYPLPEMVRTLREQLYPELAPVANAWMEALEIDRHFPKSFREFQSQCHRHQQRKPTPLILKYGKGGFNTLHQDLYGEIYFPFQAVFFLNEAGVDFTGGEFVLTQQTPRAQSRAIVLTPGKGDMLIFTTNFRPVRGKKGYYRVHMKHGVSEVRCGERHTLGIPFHDANT